MWRWRLTWAFDDQNDGVHYLEGSEEAVKAMYGILLQHKDKLFYAAMTEVLSETEDIDLKKP